MSVLSDSSIKARPSLITPYDARSVGPCSLDLHLGDTLLRWPYGYVLDPETDQAPIWQPMPLRDDGRWLIGARELYLGVTAESITIPDDGMALLHGISSLGRYGLLIHVTAGLVDAGWLDAPLTLEIVSLGGPIYLRPGMRIGQLTFHKLDKPADRPYKGRYQSDSGPTPSRAHLDRERVP